MPSGPELPVGVGVLDLLRQVFRRYPDELANGELPLMVAPVKLSPLSLLGQFQPSPGFFQNLAKARGEFEGSPFALGPFL